MAWFSFFLFVSFLPIVMVIVKQSSSILTKDPTNHNPREKSSILDQILSIPDKNQQDVDELRCPEKWFQFGYSCYLLSDIVSTVRQANHTCDRFHWNDSRLMFIQQPVQLSYAAYVLTKNNLNNLMLEVDQDLMKDGTIVNILSSNDNVQWEEFGKKILQHRLKDNKEKMESTGKDRSHDDNTIERESITVAKDEMDTGNKDHHTFENIDHIRNPCHQIKWNVVNEDSNVLILTVGLDSNKSICSLSNIDFRAAYSHLCQYMLDRCLNNIICGKHGRCVNTQTDFNCSCSFLYEGSSCEKYSHKDIQNIISIILIVVSLVVTFKKPRELLFDVIKWSVNLCRQQPVPLSASASRPQPTDDENNHTESPSDETVQCPSIESSPPKEQMVKFKLETGEQHLRKKFVVISTIVFLLFFFKFPAIHHIKSTSLNHTNSSTVNSLIDGNAHMVGQYRRYTILRTDNYIFLTISSLLVILFSVLNKREKRDKNDDDDRSGLVEPIKLLRVTDRYTTTAIIVIQMFEILEVLEETVIDIDQSAQYGILAQILKRIFFVILIALRYYPTLASLQFQNLVVRLLTTVYFISSSAYITFFGNLDIHWLLFLLKTLPSMQRSLHIDISSWSFFHGFVKNILHYLLIGYICAELIMRLFYDSIYIAWKRGRRIWDIPHRTIDQYSFHADRKKKRFLRNPNKKAAAEANSNTGNANSDQQGCWDSVRTYISSIYIWDNKFRFTTIAVCTYTVAYIFLFHLTGTVILLYQTQTNSYIRYIKQVFELMLNIEIKEWSFQSEVIISALITMMIYGVQLFLSIKNFRESMGDLYNKFSEDPELGKKLKKREIIRQSTQYPSYLLLYLLGGFFICFHLILLFSVTVKRVIFTHIGSSKGVIGYIIPILILYLLQKMIIRWLHQIFDYFDQRDEKNLNLKLNIFDSILLYLKLISCSFIGIIASIIRVIFSVLVNIIFMPRIDYSYLVEPLQGLDSAHEAFKSFIRLEMLCIYPFILDFSPSIKPAFPTDILPDETIVEAVEPGEYHDAENNEETQSEFDVMDEIDQNNHAAPTSASQRQSPRRSSRRVNEPMSFSTELDDGEDIRDRFLP